MLESKSWGTNISLGTAVSDACRCMLLLVVLLFLLLSLSRYTVRASAKINKQRWCWLSMSVGRSGGNAAKSATVVAAPLGLVMRACCGHRSTLRKLAVLPYGMVPGRSFQKYTIQTRQLSD